jgi:Flp pilus assembly protein TadD
MSKKANAEGLQLLKASNPDFEAAKRKFEEAVRSDPSNVEALNNLGYVYQRLGDFRTSEAHILKVIPLPPDRRVAYGNLGYVQAKLAKSSEASHNFCEYIKRFNDFERGKATLKRVMSDPDVNVQSAVNEAIARCSAR